MGLQTSDLEDSSTPGLLTIKIDSFLQALPIHTSELP